MISRCSTRGGRVGRGVGVIWGVWVAVGGGAVAVGCAVGLAVGAGGPGVAVDGGSVGGVNSGVGDAGVVGIAAGSTVSAGAALPAMSSLRLPS